MYFQKRNIQNKGNQNSIHGILKSIKKYNIIKNIVLLLSIVSVNFAAYIAYYDINIFILIDSSAIMKYIFGLLILFAFVSAVITLFLLFLEKYLFMPFSILHITNQKTVSSVINLLRFPLILFIFNIIYVGWSNTLKIVIIFIFYFGIIFVTDLINKSDLVSKKNKTLNPIASIKSILKGKKINIKNMIKEYFIFIKDFFKFFVTLNPESLKLKQFFLVSLVLCFYYYPC